MSNDQWAARLRRSRLLNIVLAVAVAFLLVVTFAQATRGSGPSASGSAETSPTASAEPEASPTPEPLRNDYARHDADDPLAIGDPDAPVVLVEWTDMRCPFCAAFSRDTLPTVIEEYVDSGKVRIEFHDVAFFGEQSASAAVAVRAAAQQDLGVEYMDALFEAAPETGHPDLPREQLIAFAEQVGIPDIAAFSAALDDPALNTEVLQATADAQALGVNVVPFFFAGSNPLSGAQPIEVFREYLDEAVAQAG